MHVESINSIISVIIIFCQRGKNIIFIYVNLIFSINYKANVSICVINLHPLTCIHIVTLCLLL